MHVSRWARCPLIAKHDRARRWLQTVADLGHARNTVEAYGRAVEEYICFTKSLGATPETAKREHVATRSFAADEERFWVQGNRD